MNWFRVYIDARNDAKLRTLTDAEHRVWFHLLCYAAEQPNRGTIEGVTGVTGVTDVTSALLLAIEVANGDTALLTKTVEKLVNLRVLSIDDEGLSFINFTKRQYDKPSDMPEKTRERKAAQRERERAQNSSNNDDESVTGVTARDVTTRTEQSREEQTKEEPPKSPKGDGSNLKVIDGGRTPTPSEQRFDLFWKAYPRRIGKQAALKIWQRIKPDDAMTETIIAAVNLQKTSRDWKRDNGQYIPNPATWLNQGRWDDDPIFGETETKKYQYNSPRAEGPVF